MAPTAMSRRVVHLRREQRAGDRSHASRLDRVRVDHREIRRAGMRRIIRVRVARAFDLDLFLIGPREIFREPKIAFRDTREHQT